MKKLLISFLIIIMLGVVAFGGYCWFDYLKNNVDNSNNEQIKDDSNESEELHWLECFASKIESKKYDCNCVLISSDNRLAIVSCFMTDGVLTSYDIFDDEGNMLSGPFSIAYITNTTVSGSDKIITFKDDLAAKTEYQLTISGEELTFREGHYQAGKTFTRSEIPTFIGKYVR